MIVLGRRCNFGIYIFDSGRTNKTTRETHFIDLRHLFYMNYFYTRIKCSFAKHLYKLLTIKLSDFCLISFSIFQDLLINAFLFIYLTRIKIIILLRPYNQVPVQT